jgi:hypothetical protein
LSDDSANNELSDFWIDKVPPMERETNEKRTFGGASDVLARSRQVSEEAEDRAPKRPSEKSTKATQAFLRSLNGVEKTFRNLNRKSDLNYTLIVSLNATMFIIGAALLGLAAYLAISSVQNPSSNGQDNGNNSNSATTATIGGIGIADIVTILLVNPQARIRKMHSDFIQMNIIYNTWMHQMQSAFLRLRNAEFADNDVSEFQQSLGKFSASAIRAIEKYTEAPEQAQGNGKDDKDQEEKDLDKNMTSKDGKGKKKGNGKS